MSRDPSEFSQRGASVDTPIWPNDYFKSHLGDHPDDEMDTVIADCLLENLRTFGKNFEPLRGPNSEPYSLSDRKYRSLGESICRP